MLVVPNMYEEAMNTLLLLKPTTTMPKQPSDTSFPTILPDPPLFERAGKTGRTTLWITFAIMVIATLGFVVLSWTVPASKRIYHSLTTLAVVISTLAYFGMATGGGFFFHHTRHRERHDNGLPDTFIHVHRQLFYAHFIDWAFATPLLLLNLAALAGLNGANILSAGSASIIMVFAGFFSTESFRKRQRWGWFTVAAISYLWIVYTLALTGRRAASAKGAKVSRFYTMIASYSILVWAAYPVIWALAGNTRLVNVDTEIIAYAVVDILAKVAFGAWLLFTYRSTPETHVTIDGFWANGFESEGLIRVGDGEDGA